MESTPTLQDLEYQFYKESLAGSIGTTVQKMGWYDYNDTATASTPIALSVVDTWYPLPNDTLGSFTAKYPFTDVAEVWNPVTGSFDFSDLPLYSTIDLRLDVQFTSGSPNTALDISLFVDDGNVGQFQIPFIVEQNYKLAGTRQVIRYNGLYIGSSAVQNGPARFKAKSDTTGASVIVYGWYAKIHKP